MATSNSIPLTFRAAPLPEGYKADPEQFKNDIVARLYAESTEAISFFAAGSVAPSSNVGPWLKNGTEWYVWSDSLAMYVPQPVPQASLRFIAQNAAPDETIYIFWIELDVGGKAQAINYYSGGAWKDVYEDTFAAIAADRAAGDASTLASANAYTDAAIAGIPGTTIVAGQGIFKAGNSGTQNVVFGGPGNMTGTIDLGSEVFDPDNCFASNLFTAPANGYYVFHGEVSVAYSGGSPVTTNIIVEFSVNGTPGAGFNNEETEGTAGQTIVGSTCVFLSSGDTVGLDYDFTMGAATTVEILGARLDGYRIR